MRPERFNYVLDNERRSRFDYFRLFAAAEGPRLLLRFSTSFIRFVRIYENLLISHVGGKIKMQIKFCKKK